MDGTLPPTATAAERVLAHGRYSLLRKLGEGGMATVYEALDQSAGRRVALKLLRETTGHRADSYRALFQQEFLALAQLSHPRIVMAYDYGIDAGVPYFTMELLDGGDLREMAPTDYRTACALARDVCSALSLVHSRRMVYRDLSPNNVRCTSEGLAKLIDFGALMPMGPSKDLVGTLPCVSPEAVNGEPLDARTDLYALGATLYYALVARHAYPARDVAELRRVFGQRPHAPSEWVPGIPRALDELVLDLLELDRAHRPDSAAEVMERLSAIAQLPRNEDLLVGHAYLATPELVDRADSLAKVRERVSELPHKRGGSLIVTGARGVGRSRLLEVAVLEAKLAGALVLCANAQAAHTEFGVARILARELLQQAPQLARANAAPHLASFSALLPELTAQEGAPSSSPSESEDPAELGRQLQRGLREWMNAVAEQSPLVVVVDDLDRIDTPSAVFVALLARDAATRPVFVLSSETSEGGKTGAAQGARHILAAASSLALLKPLHPDASERLLGSVFGEVPHLKQTAQHIHRVAGGVPRDVMLLAQHLVSENIACYQAGAWTLPSRLSATDLPESMTDALMQRVRRFSSEARTLAYALASEPTFGFSTDDCGMLTDLPDQDAAHALDALVRAGFATVTDGAARATQGACSAPLDQVLCHEELRTLHLRLSSLCEGRADLLRSAQHLYRAEEGERALSMLIAHAAESCELTRASAKAFQELLRNLPSGWFAVYERAIEDCDRFRRSPRDQCMLLMRLSGLLAHAGSDLNAYAYQQRLMDRLAYDCGLDLVDEVPKALEPTARAKAILGRAHERYRATAPSKRGLDPRSALKELPSQVVTSLGVLAYSNDYEAWLRLPSLAPLEPIAAPMSVVTGLVNAVGARICGKSGQALTRYQQLLERLEEPDRAGLEPTHHLHVHVRVIGTIGLFEAALGRKSCLERANLVGQAPRYESTALQIRQLYALFHGQLRNARSIAQQVEVVRLESNATHPQEAHFEFNQLHAFVLANDLTGVRRSFEALGPRAEHHRTFQAALTYAQGAYELIRGNPTAALAALERTLALMVPGQHVLWAPAAATHVHTLVALGRSDEASALGRGYLETCQKVRCEPCSIELALAVALNGQGNPSAAVELTEQAIARLKSNEVRGLALAAAYETRAQLAVALDDEAAFRRFSALYAAAAPSANRSLRDASKGAREALEGAPDPQVTLADFRSRLQSGSTYFERIRSGLEVLGQSADAVAGVAYARTEHGLVRASWFGEASRDPAIDTWAGAFFEREVLEHVTEDLQEEPKAVEAGVESAAYLPLLLGHDDEDGYQYTGLAVFIGAEPGARLRFHDLVPDFSKALTAAP